MGETAPHIAAWPNIPVELMAHSARFFVHSQLCFLWAAAHRRRSASKEQRHMRRAALLHILVWAMWFISAPSWAAERKGWVHLADCQYVEQAYNDGDSIHVHCGVQEFIVRLYFV